METASRNLSNVAIDYRLRNLRRSIDQAVLEAGRAPESVRLIGVSKNQPAEAVAAAIAGGLYDIGENRVQEVEEKKPSVEELIKREGIDPGAVRWHLVGRLQSNKAAKAARLFDVVHSLDSLKTARKLSEACIQIGKSTDVLIEVNLSGEASKAGLDPVSVDGFLSELSTLQGLRVVGLMTIGPLTDDDTKIRNAFEELRQLRDHLLVMGYVGLLGGELSMGMSGDWPLAIKAGATMLRIGTALFGEINDINGCR